MCHNNFIEYHSLVGKSYTVHTIQYKWWIGTRFLSTAAAYYGELVEQILCDLLSLFIGRQSQTLTSDLDSYKIKHNVHLH